MTATNPTTFLDAATRYGVPVRPDADSIVVRIAGDRIIHSSLKAQQNKPLATRRDVYIASGGFLPGAVTEHQGRSRQNLQRIWFLPFDCDLADFYAMAKEEVYALPQDEIEAMLPPLVQAATHALRAVGLPITGVDYTGHGILCRVRLASTDNDRIAEIQDAHKELVRRINVAAGFRLVDPACTDAGTRIVRLVGSLNGKSLAYGQPARQTRPLAETDDYLRVDQLLNLTREQRRPAAPTPLLAAHGKELPAEQAQAIVDALAPHWILGQKHALSLAIGGMLAKAGVPEGQALQIVEALSADDRKPWDRRNSVTSSYARVRAGADVRGYFALREWVPADVVEFVDNILDQFRQSSAPKIVVKERSKDPDEFVASMKIDPMPGICYEWPWLTDYLDLVAPASEAPDQFHLATALSIAGATFGRSVCTRYVSKSVYGNLYQMLVGSAGTSRKDTAIRFGVDLPYQKSSGGTMHTPMYNAISDIGSAQGLIKELTEKPNTLLYITEYQRLSQQAHRQSTATIIPTLTAAWDTPLELQNKTLGSSMQARLPYLSILAAVQPGILAEEMTAADIQSGYATRWLYVPGLGKPDGLPDPPEIDERVAYRLYARLLEIEKHYSQGGHETRLYLSEDAKERWAAWYHADRKRGHASEDEASMGSRLALHIRKIAVIYAALADATEITPEHLEPAIAYVEWCWKHTRQLMRTWGVGIFNQIEERIELVLASRGPMKRRDLYHQCKNRKWSTKEFIQVFESMVKTGSVLVDPTGLVELGR